MIKFKKHYTIGIVIGLILVVFDVVYFLKSRWFLTFLIIAINIGWSQFWIDFFKENKRQKEIESRFLQFVRSLVGTVKSGISIPNSIIQIANEDYGPLTPYVKKLRNQIEWGIPIQEALINFGEDTNNPIINRAVSIVLEAERSGGEIGDVLDSVTSSVVNIKKMKEERKASVFSQIVQGYIVFFVFIVIMLVLQLYLFPQIQEVGSLGGLTGIDFAQGIVGEAEEVNLDSTFFSLILIQGFFAGIMIGKFSEGTIKQGVMHSLILMTSAALIITTAKGGI
ncbi:MAG: type II secretion system F family protein [Candidatus Nanoarchaeia archaeon]|jgi:flagellar protein FlaJ|nr:type II secretion system F family protein [Candidatus Nanoarchaeia archaeon]|tara:strand:+ start:41924 stop:42766 length:843 start_codon:yes stop_codon:yes gene_type:complete